MVTKAVTTEMRDGKLIITVPRDTPLPNTISVAVSLSEKDKQELKAALSTIQQILDRPDLDNKDNQGIKQDIKELKKQLPKKD